MSCRDGGALVWEPELEGGTIARLDGRDVDMME